MFCVYDNDNNNNEKMKKYISKSRLIREFYMRKIHRMKCERDFLEERVMRL